MTNLIVVYSFGILVFFSVTSLFRAALGKAENGLKEITGEANGIVGLEVTKG